MAYSVVETKVVNPARKRTRMAKRKLSAKQIKAGFGGKRRKAAAKQRHRPAAKRANPTRRRARRNTARRAAPRRPTHRKRNPTPEIISLVMGNPSRKKGSTMARRKNASHRHRKANPAGTRRRRRNTVKIYNRARRRRNPAGLGRPMDWLKGGAGVLGGVVVTRLVPQTLAPTYNTSWTGYAMNAVTAIAAAWGTHALTKDPVLTSAVAAGGFAAVIARIITDMTPYGSYLALSGVGGVGDYQVANFVSPQRIVNQRQALMQVPGGWGSQPALTASYSDAQNMGADSNGYANDY